MEDIMKERLVNIGVDVDVALERFMGNGELLVRFLKKFTQDGSYELFKTTMAEKNYDDAFKAAHTLKGLCGNLSLTNLYDLTSKEVEYLRHEHFEEAEQMLPMIVQEYDKVFKELNSL